MGAYRLLRLLIERDVSSYRHRQLIHDNSNNEGRKYRGLTNSNLQTPNNITAADQSVSTSQKYIFQANNSSLDSAGDFRYKWSGQSLSKKAVLPDLLSFRR